MPGPDPKYVGRQRSQTLVPGTLWDRIGGAYTGAVGGYEQEGIGGVLGGARRGQRLAGLGNWVDEPSPEDFQTKITPKTKPLPSTLAPPSPWLQDPEQVGMVAGRLLDKVQMSGTLPKGGYLLSQMPLEFRDHVASEAAKKNLPVPIGWDPAALSRQEREMATRLQIQGLRQNRENEKLAAKARAQERLASLFEDK